MLTTAPSNAGGGEASGEGGAADVVEGHVYAVAAGGVQYRLEQRRH